MEQQSTGLDFDETGIAGALRQRPLKVPLNQRPYAWTKQEVQTLLSDITGAFLGGDTIYFLGMIVVTYGAAGEIEVADGQQRLATAAILIAAIRDYLIELGDSKAAIKYQEDYLLEYYPRAKEDRAKLKLNSEDDNFFLETVLKAPADRKPYKGRSFSSHERLADAAYLAHRQIRDITKTNRSTSEKAERLYELIEFLREAVKVIVISVPGHVGNAFKMFETLNARGLPASQVDILKNYLFEHAKEKIDEVHPRWASMLSTIESLGEDDLLISYIRHYWIAHYGPTTQREIGEDVEKKIRSERQALDAVRNLDSFAVDYVALLTPLEHPRWKSFSRQARLCLHTITRELGIEQIRPLLLAIVRSFTQIEAEKAFEMCLSCSVRFLVVGGGGGGLLDRHYGLHAAEITNNEITTAKKLLQAMHEIIPSDEVFKKAFEIVTVRRANLARYYLRSIELHLKQERKPQLVPNEDTNAVNIEHILPVTPSTDWKLAPEIAASLYRRLGNMVLLGARDNVDIGNKSFREKKKTFAKSPFDLTRKIAQFDKWGAEEIEKVQHELAEHVSKVWPI